MIHIFPRMEYSIDSTKSPEEIYTILKSVTEPWKIVLSRSDNIYFMGEVNPSNFKIIRENTYLYTRTVNNKDVRMYESNSFKPVIRGTIRMKRGLLLLISKCVCFYLCAYF